MGSIRTWWCYRSSIESIVGWVCSASAHAQASAWYGRSCGSVIISRQCPSLWKSSSPNLRLQLPHLSVGLLKISSHNIMVEFAIEGCTYRHRDCCRGVELFVFESSQWTDNLGAIQFSEVRLSEKHHMTASTLCRFWANFFNLYWERLPHFSSRLSSSGDRLLVRLQYLDL